MFYCCFIHLFGVFVTYSSDWHIVTLGSVISVTPQCISKSIEVSMYYKHYCFGFSQIQDAYSRYDHPLLINHPSGVVFLSL